MHFGANHFAAQHFTGYHFGAVAPVVAGELAPNTIGVIVNQARDLLQDKSKRYWSDGELVDYANAGRSLWFSLNPTIYETTVDFTCAAGARQTLPENSNAFFWALYNVSAISRRAITPVDAELLARARPRWRSEAQSDEIVHVMYKDSDPRHFDVYPPASDGTVIKISYAKPPVHFTIADLTLDTKTLDAEGDAAPALVDYIVHRALTKQADTSPDAGQMSGDYLKLFMTKIGAEDQSKAARLVNATSLGMQRGA